MQIRGGPGPPGLQRQDLAQRIHQRMDRDQDGSVSKAELTEVAKAQSGAGPAVEVHIDALYDKLDADGSGGLSVDEMGGLAKRAASAGRGNRPAGLSPVRPPVAPQGGMSALLDALEPADDADETEDADDVVTAETRRAVDAYGAASAM